MSYSRRVLDDSNVLTLEHLIFEKRMLKFNHSKFGYHCPVTWKFEKKLSKSHNNLELSVCYKGHHYFFANREKRDLFISNPEKFYDHVSFPSNKLPRTFKMHKAVEMNRKEKALNGYCPVSIVQNEEVEKSLGFTLFLSVYNGDGFIFESIQKLDQFIAEPERYCNAVLPVKMPPPKDKITLMNISELEDSSPFLRQAVGQIATRALLEVGSTRLKYPGLSVRETALKLFALFLKANNPSNTPYMTDKYTKKIQMFVKRCEMPSQIYKMHKKRGKIANVNILDKGKKWTEYEEKYFHEKGDEFDRTLLIIK